MTKLTLGFPGGSDGKETTCNAGDLEKGMATLIFLSGEFHGQISLVGYSPGDPKDLDMTEQLTLSLTRY